MEELNPKEIQQLFQKCVLELTQRTVVGPDKLFAFPCGGGGYDGCHL